MWPWPRARRCRGRHPARVGGGLHLPGLRRHRPTCAPRRPAPSAPFRGARSGQPRRERQRQRPVRGWGAPLSTFWKAPGAARQALGARRPDEIVFTSGATEADDAAILGLCAGGRRAAPPCRQKNRPCTSSPPPSSTMPCSRLPAPRGRGRARHLPAPQPPGLHRGRVSRRGAHRRHGARLVQAANSGWAPSSPSASWPRWPTSAAPSSTPMPCRRWARCP